jgi:phosphate transport system substrate-binding protein
MRLWRSRPRAVSACLLSLTVACGRAPQDSAGGGASGGAAAGSGTITLAGSTSVQPFAEKWAETYQARNPGVQINVQGGGSTAGVKAAESGAAQIGMCSRELKPEEASVLTATIVARDGETIIVHPSLSVSDLTVDQVRGIYAGEITYWKQVGGPDLEITVVTREMGSGARGAFEDLVMGKEKKIASSALVQDSQGAVRQMVSSAPAAIGYVSHGVVDPSVKGLKLNGVEPNPDTIKSGRYPLVRPFLFLTKGAPSGRAKEFIEWVLGPDGQAVARKEGLFPPA